MSNCEPSGLRGVGNWRAVTMKERAWVQAVFPRSVSASSYCGLVAATTVTGDEKWVCSREKGHAGPHVAHFTENGTPRFIAFRNYQQEEIVGVIRELRDLEVALR